MECDQKEEEEYPLRSTWKDDGKLVIADIRSRVSTRHFLKQCRPRSFLVCVVQSTCAPEPLITPYLSRRPRRDELKSACMHVLKHKGCCKSSVRCWLFYDKQNYATHAEKQAVEASRIGSRENTGIGIPTFLEVVKSCVLNLRLVTFSRLISGRCVRGWVGRDGIMRWMAHELRACVLSRLAVRVVLLAMRFRMTTNSTTDL